MPGTPLLPPATHVGRVILQVADLDHSLGFYEDVVGFRVIDHTIVDGRRVARLGLDRPTTHLLELREKPGVRRVPPRGLIGLYHFAILLPERADLGRFIVHAANAGAPFAAADHLFSEALYLTDPDGLQVEVYRDRPRHEWTFHHGGIVGDTLPLDFDPIVAAAAGTAWTGLPAGTVIGHVHLYVRDLVQARAFYVSALGFAPTLTSFPGALFVAAGDYHHHVGLNTWAAGAPQATDDDARMLLWELVLPDPTHVAAAAARLRDAGHAVTADDAAFVVHDPWNIAVRLTTGQ
ncbi:MAG: VOC family protein [Acidobacteria bacterium]|nr:VOC family protein [Acidobacteriota bacterium]